MKNDEILVFIGSGGPVMGTYLNPGGVKFGEAVNSEIYIDKTGMIAYLNTIVRTEQKYVSISRPRRFGKTIAANMLAAYYGRGDSRQMFEGMKIPSLHRCSLQSIPALRRMR